jgi:cytochrome c553
MSLQLHPEPLRHQGRRERFSRHVWIVILLVVAACILALCGRSASAQLDRVEETIERALALKPDPSDGERLYRKHCSACHGRKAEGKSHTVVPALAGQVAPYLIKQLADLVEGYRDLPEMHRQVARADLVTPQAMHDLAAFLSALPPPTEPQLGDGKQLVLGGRIYKSVCADCHRAGGEGDDRSRTPALRGQHYSYLLRQARQLAAGHRYSVDISVLVLLEALSLDQLTAVADFISRLPASSETETLARSVCNSLRSARTERAICPGPEIRI